MIRVQKNIDAFPQGKDARERARLSSKQKDARVEPVEEICITMGKTEQLQIKPKVKNKDTITSMMSLVSNPSQNKTIEIPCKFLTGDLKTFNQKLQEGPAAFFNYLEKAFRLALWEMSYEKNNHVVNMDEFNNVIFGGDFDAVQFFINKQVDINVAAKGGWTPVMSAAAQGQIKILVYLLNHGGNPNFQNLMKATALMHVAKHDDLDSAKVLVSFGADLNLQDFEGNTALMKAISDRSAKVALFLINHGADTSIKNKKGEDALRLAEKNYMGEIAKILRLNNSSTKSAPLQAQNQSFSKQQRKKKKKK